MTAKLTILYLYILICVIFETKSFAQEEETHLEDNDPIGNSIAQHEKNIMLGTRFTEDEFNKLERINKRYKLSAEEKKLQHSYGDTLTVMEQFKLARSYRKQYMHTKKIEKFRKEKIESMQTPRALQRMRESEKRTKARYKKRKRDARRKKFLNLFK